VTDLRRRPCLLAPLLVALASGCTPMGAKPGRVDVSSDPAGADVYVMGSKVGVTPLVLDQDAIFPLTYPGEKQALYGVVELRKAGCLPARQNVSTRAVSRGLHVKLDCGEAARAETPASHQTQPAQPAGSANEQAPATPAAKATPDIEQRLKQVQELRDKGLITEQEAQEIRQRILGEL
jgi:hypothetical protein